MKRPVKSMRSKEGPEGNGTPVGTPTQSDESVPVQASLFGEPGEGPRDEGRHELEPLLDKVLVIDGTLSPVYLGSMLVGSLLLMAAGAFDLFPWAASAAGVAGLLATMFRGGRWIALACSAAVIVVAGAGLWPREATLADAGVVGAIGDRQDTASEQPPDGSLGFRLGELGDMWNALEQPPRVNRGFSRSSEPGPLDGFVIRFDQGASLAGAYDPSDDFVYALSASSRLDHEAATTMYLHLCFLLHPYSQECIDAYWDEGLDGATAADFLGSRHKSEWQIGSQTWRLAIVGNVQEIKVLGEPPS